MLNRQPLPLKNLFSATPLLASLLQKSVRLLAINRALQTLLPRTLRPHCRVANFRRGILVIEIANASWHQRFRYEQPELLSALRKQYLPELVTIVIKINPLLLQKADSVTTSNASANIGRRPLSAHSALMLRQLATRCPLGLRKILLKLATLEHTTVPDSST